MILKSSKIADLDSLIGGVHLHSNRFDQLTTFFPNLDSSKIVFAFPNVIKSSHSIEWWVENVEIIGPLSNFSGDQRIQYEKLFQQGVKELFDSSIYASSKGGDSEFKKVLPERIGKNTEDSVFVGRRNGSLCFVVTEWAFTSGVIGSVDGGPGLGTNRFDASIIVMDRNGRVVPNVRWKVKKASEEFELVSDDHGHLSLANIAEGTPILFEQELKFGITNKQPRTLFSDKDPQQVTWIRQSWVKFLHDQNLENPIGRYRLDDKIQKLTFREDGVTVLGGFIENDRFQLLSESNEILEQIVLVEGENLIDLRTPEESIPEVETNEPSKVTPVKLNFSGRFGFAVKGLNFELNHPQSNPILSSSHVTSNEGGVQVDWPVDSPKGILRFEYLGSSREIEVIHEADILEHNIRLTSSIPRWFWFSLFAILVIFAVLNFPIRYQPTLRLVNGRTNAPIPGAVVGFLNVASHSSKDTLIWMDTEADSSGVATLNLGKRKVYEWLFQLNSRNPITASAIGYHPSRSIISKRTWYWTEDWPLAPLNDDEVVLLAWNIGIRDYTRQNPIPGTTFEVQCIDRPELPVQRKTADGDGEVVLKLDRRYSYKIKASHPGFTTEIKTEPSEAFGSMPIARFDLVPLLPCSGGGANNGDMNTLQAFDMKTEPNSFCFRAGNYDQYDLIEVRDAFGNLLYRLEPTSTLQQDGSGGGLGINETPCYLIYEEVLITSPSRIVFVYTEGTSVWSYQVSCPGESCDPGVHSDNPLFPCN